MEEGKDKKTMAAEAALADARVKTRACVKDMMEAARQDYLARQAGKPAVGKLMCLDKVRAAVANKRLHEFLLEGTVEGQDAPEGASTTILDAFREWLRPLSGATMPSQQIREAVYDLLGKLPVTQDHLRCGREPLLLWKRSRKSWLAFIKTREIEKHFDHFPVKLIYGEWSGIMLDKLLELDKEFWHED